MSHGGGQPRGAGEKKGPTLPKYSRASMLAKRGALNKSDTATSSDSGGKSVSWGNVPEQSVSVVSDSGLSSASAEDPHAPASVESVPADNDYEESVGVVSASGVNISGSSVSSLSAEDMQVRDIDYQVPVQSVSVVSFSGVSIPGSSVSGLSPASAGDPHAPASGESVQHILMQA